MPRKRVETGVKQCRQCGANFTRKPRQPLSWWKTARYCSTDCARQSRKPKMENCKQCGTAFPAYSQGKRTPRQFCSLPCASRANRKPDSEIKSRYRQTKSKGRKVSAHRLVMEQEIGRPLGSTEYVHHEDENRLNNDLGNLQITNPVKHGRHHHLKYPLTKTCIICGTEFTPHKTKRKRQKTCLARKCVNAAIQLGRSG